MLDWLDISDWFGLPEAASAHAAEVDYMMSLVHWLMLILFLIWAPYFIYVLFRFRKAKQPVAVYEGTKSRLSTYLEVSVVLAEVLLLFGFAFPLWGQLRADFPTESDATVVHVVGEQFAWNIHYAGADGVFGTRTPELVDVATNPLGLDRDDPNAQDDITTVNELHVPTGKPVLIYLSSKDVIHSFSLPTMRVKQDAIPGELIPVWFEPTVEGESEIGCAQLCGIGHYRMRGYLTVHSPGDFETWLQGQASQAL